MFSGWVVGCVGDQVLCLMNCGECRGGYVCWIVFEVGGASWWWVWFVVEHTPIHMRQTYTPLLPSNPNPFYPQTYLDDEPRDGHHGEAAVVELLGLVRVPALVRLLHPLPRAQVVPRLVPRQLADLALDS